MLGKLVTAGAVAAAAILLTKKKQQQDAEGAQAAAPSVDADTTPVATSDAASPTDPGVSTEPTVAPGLQ